MSSLDGLSNRKTGWNKYLTVELKNGKYVWKVDGHFRTVTTTPPIGKDAWGTERPVQLDHRYKILHKQGQSFVADCVGKFQLLFILSCTTHCADSFESDSLSLYVQSQLQLQDVQSQFCHPLEI